MPDPFQCLADSLRSSAMGAQAVLRGDTPTTVLLDRNVATTGAYGEASTPRTFATIDRRLSPAVGDTLTIPSTGEAFVLDGCETDDGYDMVFVLV